MTVLFLELLQRLHFQQTRRYEKTRKSKQKNISYIRVEAGKICMAPSLPRKELTLNRLSQLSADQGCGAHVKLIAFNLSMRYLSICEDFFSFSFLYSLLCLSTHLPRLLNS